MDRTSKDKVEEFGLEEYIPVLTGTCKSKKTKQARLTYTLVLRLIKEGLTRPEEMKSYILRHGKVSDWRAVRTVLSLGHYEQEFSVCCLPTLNEVRKEIKKPLFLRKRKIITLNTITTDG